MSEHQAIELTLPWPPSVNTYWRNVNGKTLISKEGRLYRQAVREQVNDQNGVQSLAGRLSVSIVAHVPDQRRRDLDNLLKAVLDGMTHAGVWLDDSQIDELQIRRGPIGGMLKVSVLEEPMTPKEPVKLISCSKCRGRGWSVVT
jgi:crossover junction endodeoxyribonuclease RusA